MHSAVASYKQHCKRNRRSQVYISQELLFVIDRVNYFIIVQYSCDLCGISSSQIKMWTVGKLVFVSVLVLIETSALQVRQSTNVKKYIFFFNYKYKYQCITLYNVINLHHIIAQVSLIYFFLFNFRNPIINAKSLQLLRRKSKMSSTRARMKSKLLFYQVSKNNSMRNILSNTIMYSYTSKFSITVFNSATFTQINHTNPLKRKT